MPSTRGRKGPRTKVKVNAVPRGPPPPHPQTQPGGVQLPGSLTPPPAAMLLLLEHSVLCLPNSLVSYSSPPSKMEYF